MINIGIPTFGCDPKSGMSRYICNLLANFAVSSGKDRFHVMAHVGAMDEYLENVPAGFMQTHAVADWLKNPILNIAWHQTALQCHCVRQQLDVLFLPAASRRTPVWSTCPTVGTIHDLTPFHVPEKYDAARSFYQKHVLTRMLRQLDHVIAISECTKRDIQNFIGIPDEKISVIHHAADTTTFFPRDKQASLEPLARYGITGPFAVYTSRIEHPAKNHVRLIQAFDLLKAQTGIPHQLVLAGADWHGASEVHDAARSARFASDIVLTGFVRSADLPLLYCAADLMVFPSLFEGFGLPVLEAMASGVPVACSNVSSLPEIAGNAAELFDPLDVPAIAQAMQNILSNPEVAMRYVQLGMDRASQFSWKKTAEQTLATLHKVARQ